MYAIARVHFRDVELGLDGMDARTRHLGPVFNTLKKPLREDQRDHKKTKSGPDAGWTPRAASTSHGGKRKLARSLLGRLPGAVKYSADGYSVIAESRVAWSAAHQEGAVVGHGARLPERIFLWLSERFIDLGVEALEEALIKAFGGKH